MKKAIIWLLFTLLIFGIIQPITSLVSGETLLKTEPKPLEIKGPMTTEVNETISFVVISEGMPVKGAVVSFAGYEKETNNSGIATFQIDFAGCFKAVARKEGYETNSTLIWVFPKGNENLLVRSTKSVSEPQPHGVTISSFRMAGFNYARIKAYYTYDAQGNIYPYLNFPPYFKMFLPYFPEPLNESVELVKKLYPNENVPHYGLIRVPIDIKLKSLAWIISEVRSWGFKVFLQSQLFFIDPSTGELKEPREQPLQEKAKQTFLKQLKEQVLTLAIFAEEQKVELFEPFRHFDLLPSEEYISLYKELLPELRKVYSGKLVLSPDVLDVDFSLDLEEVLAGYDYVEVLAARNPPLNPNTSDYEKTIRKYLNFVDNLRSKYGIEPLPEYIGHIDVIRQQFTSDEHFTEFMSNFNSTEDVRVWFINNIVNETLSRAFIGVDVHPLWFFHMKYPIYDGEIFKKFSYWPTKRLTNVVAKYLIHPYNEDGKIALIMLQHIKLAQNSMLATSSNLQLVHWASSSLKESLRAYEKGEYMHARSVLQEMLGFFMHVRNPLNITIDGDGSDWNYVDPVYFNPNRESRYWFNIVFWYGNEVINNVGNLKSVYAVNDPWYLYLMLEFYDGPPKWLPPIVIDTSGEWSHEDGKEFFIPLERGSTDIWKVSYTNMPEYFDPQNPSSLKIGKVDVKVNNVVELKIPLRLLGNPKKINIIVWYWDLSTPKGDMEIDLIDWGSPSRISSMFISVSQPKVFIGETIRVSGFIYPAHANAKVTLTYKMPNGTILTRKVTSSVLGEFEDAFEPKMSGNWTVKASWDGDLDHGGAESPETSFTVIAPTSVTTTVTTVKPTTLTSLVTTTMTLTITEISTTTEIKTTTLTKAGLESILLAPIVLVTGATVVLIIILLSRKRRI